MKKTLLEKYKRIKSQCLIVTASDSKHAPYLLNALLSLTTNFKDRPNLVVYNLGLSAKQKKEILKFSGVTICDVEKFVNFTDLNWSWKIWALKHCAARYVLYFDLPNMVVLRSFETWFLSIQSNGYFVVHNNQVMNEIVPDEYWQLMAIDKTTLFNCATFGAGIVGFDKESFSYSAINKAYLYTKVGLNLGRSVGEKSNNYKPNIVRNCLCFRADQTLLNIAFREVYGTNLKVKNYVRLLKYSACDKNKSLYIWYARRSKESLSFLFKFDVKDDFTFNLIKAYWFFKIRLKYGIQYIISILP